MLHKISALVAMCCVTLTGGAQTILSEDFETGSTETYSSPIATGEGWSTVSSYTGDRTEFTWTNYYSEKGSIGGQHVAYCDAPTYTGATGGGEGPREEILLTPELNLDNTYQLSFDWKVSPMAFNKNYLYDLQVRVVTDDNVKNAETIFSMQNKEDLKESGVNEYPISTWDTHTSKLDLSEFKGKKIKIAFVFKMLASIGNCVMLDNVSVKQFTPATAPVAKLDKTSYNFGQVYVGEKFYTELFKLTNTGLSGLKVTGIDMPAGVSTTWDYSKVNLDKGEDVQFQLNYTASLTSPANANVVLHTNGGDLTINLKAQKTMVPDGMTEETFEGFFPPAGWTNTGWGRTQSALEGDYSVYAGAALSECYLTSPRLDLSKGGEVTFEFYNNFTSEDGETYQSNDISVELSTDGGATWKSIWTFPYEDDTMSNNRIWKTLTISEGSDNSYIRWHNTAVTSDDGDIPETSNFYLDRVFLPTIYGQDGVPTSVTLASPESGTQDIYPENIKLAWTPAQFADGYKVYVGKASGSYDLVNGLNVGDALSYTIPAADYETTYFWKVVPFNSVGNGPSSEEWTFKTQKDASNSDYPYVMDFSGVTGTLPTGWTSENNTTYGESRNWSVLTSKGNDAPCLFSMWVGEYGKDYYSAAITPEFKLPAGKEVKISFDWIDRHPVDAIADESGLAKKQNVEGGNGVEKVTFEILVDGNWKELSYISQDYTKALQNTTQGERYYWINETFDLSEYAGKNVKFRWVHYGYTGQDAGCAIDNINIEEKVGDKAVFNKAAWVAGKVNYNKAVNSGDIFTILNKGENALKVKSVAFNTNNFTSSLKAGDEIAAGEGKVFNLQFNANDAAAEVSDIMTVTFESGYTMTMAVSGTALAEDVLYYSFEDNPLDYDWTNDFTLIDVDHSATVPFTCWGTEFPSSGGVYAFAVAYERPDHNNVAPISGDAFLIPGSPVSEDVHGDNWIVSKLLRATSNSVFDFYARNWESKQSVLPSAMHKVEVLVSETSATDRNSFTTVMKQEEIPYLDRNEWKHYQIDLSQYAGKDIYVAVRDCNEQYALAAFYDDFTFSHFGCTPTAIKTVTTEIAADAEVSVYNLNGVLVANGTGIETLKTLGKGAYIVKAKTADGVKTMKIARK